MAILIDAPDWVTASGIRRVLEEAGHDVLLASDTARFAEEADTVRLGLIAVDDEQRLASNAAVSLCESRDVPVVWWSDADHVARLVDMSSVRTVGLLITPVHESQLLAAVRVGLALGQLTERSSASADDSFVTHPSGRDRHSVVLERFPLTPRQRAIVEMMLDGDRVSTIAEALEITPATVRAHLNRIYDKLGVRSQATLVKALKESARERERDPVA